MKKINIIILIVIAMISIHVSAGEPVMPHQQWKIDDIWEVEVRRYSNVWSISQMISKNIKIPDTPPLVAIFVLQYRVFGQKMVDGESCWIIEVTPDTENELGVPREQCCYMLIGQQSGKIIDAYEIRHFSSSRSQELMKTEAGNLFYKLPTSYPIDYYPHMIRSKVVDNWVIQFEIDTLKSDSGQMTEIEIRRRPMLDLPPEKIGEVSILWKENEKWWSEYKRYDHGYILIEARLLSDEESKSKSRKFRESNLTKVLENQ